SAAVVVVRVAVVACFDALLDDAVTTARVPARDAGVGVISISVVALLGRVEDVIATVVRVRVRTASPPGVELAACTATARVERSEGDRNASERGHRERARHGAYDTAEETPPTRGISPRAAR